VEGSLETGAMAAAAAAARRRSGVEAGSREGEGE